MCRLVPAAHAGVKRRPIWGCWARWSKTFPARSSAQNATAADRRCTQPRCGASAPDRPPSRYAPVALKTEGTDVIRYTSSTVINNRNRITIWSSQPTHPRSISSSPECGEVSAQYAAAHLPWRRWGSWLPARRCCGGSSWCHTPECSAPRLKPGKKKKIVFRNNQNRTTLWRTSGSLGQKSSSLTYPDWDDVAWTVHHGQPWIHQHLPEQLNVALVLTSKRAALFPFEDLHRLPGSG